MIDTNVINARQKSNALNQLEKWRVDGVIMLMMPKSAFVEAQAGNNVQRSNKAAAQVRAGSHRISNEQHQLFSDIEKAIFPTRASTASERRDVEIVYEAAAWKHILVTNDGDSRTQPRGILGARTELAKLQVLVMRPEEAVAHVQQKIRDRDDTIAKTCEARGTPEPAWLWND